MTRRLFAPLLLVLALLAPGCIIVSDDDLDDSTLSVVNDSDYTLIDIAVTPTGSRTWGPNLAPPGGLYPDEIITISLDCGTYDARVIDDLGAECILSRLDLCYQDADWVITNGALAGCF